VKSLIAFLILVPLIAYLALHIKASEPFVLHKIAQTGPQKEALKTDYLASFLNLHPGDSLDELALLEKKLLTSPLIREARLEKIEPDTLYIDYTVRKPLFFLKNQTNTVIDRDGCTFPFMPYFTPKSLPELCFGQTSDGFEMALSLYDTIKPWQDELNITIKQIDISKTGATSLGQREIVLIFEASGTHFLRLTPKNAQAELRRYRALLPHLRDGDHIIDLRLSPYAFIK